MNLNKHNLLKIKAEGLDIPSIKIFDLPEKVVQFGTGVLLRALPDYFIDKANKQNIFNGRIVVIKSTSNGLSNEFETQNGLYTHCIKGVKNGSIVDKQIINASISRVLNATNQWTQILDTAENPAIQLIISNTTELGITLDITDSIHNNPPITFPGKLLSWLYKRYCYFNGSTDSGVTIVPTELITENGIKLKNIVHELALINKLDQSFITWLLNSNDFCNSLVDRIVPGKMPLEQHQTTLENLRYSDDLMIMSECYALWAIEATNTKSKEALGFGNESEGLFITPNINKFQEMKLRLLNGTHTFSCGLAFLLGFETVSLALQNKKFREYLINLMNTEIAECVISETISGEELSIFANNVIDRFSNVEIQHKWLSISVNYTDKMAMRNIPLISEYYLRYNAVPEHMAIGFAAYIFFMKPTKFSNGFYYGIHNDIDYQINDVKANLFFEFWEHTSISEVVKSVLKNQNLWKTDLSKLPGFSEAVSKYLSQFLTGNLSSTFNEFNNANRVASVV